MPKAVIGIVLPYLKSRGTEKQALRLAAGFVERGADVVLFVVQGWGLESMYRAFENVGVRVVNVGLALDEGKKSVSSGRLWPLARLIRKYGCTALLSRAGMTNKITGYAGRLAFVPSVVVLSGAVGKNKPSPNLLKKWFAALRSAKAVGFPRWIVSVSQEGAENFSRSYPPLAKKVTAIPNGVDRAKTGDTPVDGLLSADKFYFCFSGSVEIGRKGLDVLVGALGLVVREHGLASAALVLIGTGEDEERIRGLVQSEGLNSHVVFAGEQTDPCGLMEQCQVFVLPSRKEGLPNALLEAMALGMCAIATDCDTGPREIISHGEDGLLVPLDDYKSLAEAMARVMLNIRLREELGDRAKITIKKRFSLEKMIDGYFSLLAERRR